LFIVIHEKLYHRGMVRRAAGLAALLWGAALVLTPAQGTGWQLPPTAADETSPLTVTGATLAEGRRLFREHCQRCHGPQGRGDGSDADPRFRRTMNLTDAARADRNPDGTVFHKILSGREKPKMPAFRDTLTSEQIWTLVAFVQSLRAKS
jgi:mono/diheme cytochrome c family protein